MQKEENYEKMCNYCCRKRYCWYYCQRYVLILLITKVNILDISQTIVSGYFNMMMIVDMSQSGKDHFDDVIEDLDKLGEDIGVVIKCQREEIFDMMHRI